MTDNLTIYRRRLPHWRATDSIYFITWRLAEHHQYLSASERNFIAAQLRHRHGERYELYAYVVMNDHIHVLVRPFGEHTLEKIVHSWKSYTAHVLQRQHGRIGRVWQEEYFDRIVRDDHDLAKQFNYILTNPWKRWPELVEYPWVWPTKDE